MKDTPIEDKILSTGYRHIRWSNECWAQFPQGVYDFILPDEFIFHPEFNRQRINKWFSNSQ